MALTFHSAVLGYQMTAQKKGCDYWHKNRIVEVSVLFSEL